MESKTGSCKPFIDYPLKLAFIAMPEAAGRNLLFYPNGQLHDYARDGRNPKSERALCVAELFLREFLKREALRRKSTASCRMAS